MPPLVLDNIITDACKNIGIYHEPQPVSLIVLHPDVGLHFQCWGCQGAVNTFIDQAVYRQQCSVTGSLVKGLHATQPFSFAAREICCIEWCMCRAVMSSTSSQSHHRAALKPSLLRAR